MRYVPYAVVIVLLVAAVFVAYEYKNGKTQMQPGICSLDCVQGDTSVICDTVYLPDFAYCEEIDTTGIVPYGWYNKWEYDCTAANNCTVVYDAEFPFQKYLCYRACMDEHLQGSFDEAIVECCRVFHDDTNFINGTIVYEFSDKAEKKVSFV